MKLPYSEFQQAEYVRHIWLATPEPNTKPEDLIVPEYWTHVSKKLQKGDFIEVTSAEGDWLAKLYVKSVSSSGVAVHMYPVEWISKPAANISPEYDVQLSGKGKWRVVRNSDKATMVDKLDSRELCEAWLIQYLKR